MKLLTNRVEWIKALNSVQAANVDTRVHYIIKEDFPVTFFNLPGAMGILYDIKGLIRRHRRNVRCFVN